MKISTLSTLLTALVISTVASSAMANNPNGPKPKCPLGQLPVLENGAYHCEDAKIKSNSAPSRSMTAPKRVKAKVALPDFKIMGAKRKPGSQNTFQVKIRNMGAGPAPQGVLFGQHFLANNQSWGADAIIPPIASGQTKLVTITIPPENYTRGDRLLFTADYFKKITESNETNNSYGMNYQ
ncbi:CARDB domain-containing protein [Sneathiella aquimaris]|uniref:CARDB domain-containing protein n=1 Tax=Sneathiella aquimaris TaxID=2599305 RepID=UPI00146A4879|nr:CARDB domain-containing protein [Sneathiella aquimaris]